MGGRTFKPHSSVTPSQWGVKYVQKADFSYGATPPVVYSCITQSSDMEPSEANPERAQDERLPKVAAVKMAVREGGKRMLDNILPSFVELVKESPSLKGEASNATYNIMKAHNVRTSVCVLK